MQIESETFDLHDFSLNIIVGNDVAASTHYDVSSAAVNAIISPICLISPIIP